MKLTKSLRTSLILLFLICFTSSPLFSQRGLLSRQARMNKTHWFADINAGIRMFGDTSPEAELENGINLNVGVGYLFSERFGIKGRFDYNSFKMSPGLGDATYTTGNAYSLSLELMTDIISFVRRSRSRASDWRIMLHGGLGLTTYGNKDFKLNHEIENPGTDPLFSGNDDMINIILGITPQYHISNWLSVNLDFSTFLLLEQDFTFDNYNYVRTDGFGNISALSLGLTFRL